MRQVAEFSQTIPCSMGLVTVIGYLLGADNGKFRHRERFSICFIGVSEISRFIAGWDRMKLGWFGICPRCAKISHPSSFVEISIKDEKVVGDYQACSESVPLTSFSGCLI